MLTSTVCHNAPPRGQLQPKRVCTLRQQCVCVRVYSTSAVLLKLSCHGLRILFKYAGFSGADPGICIGGCTLSRRNSVPLKPTTGPGGAL